MYKLEKYRGLCSKHTCPECGKKHSFILYVDENNQPLNENVGRCDHESSCGYHYPPRDYFKDNPTAIKDFKPQHHKPKRRAAKPLFTIPSKYVRKNENNNLLFYMLTLFDEDTILRLIDEYYISSTPQREAIFWQIDIQNRVRTGKIQGYDIETGKRLKGEYDHIDWAHSRLKKQGLLPDNWELTQCLYGEHLLSKYPDKVVALVEGEKNALFGSAMLPDYIWLATGCKQGLQIDKLKVLRGRTVVLFPDADAYDLWCEQAAKISFCKLQVSRLTIDKAPADGAVKGFDVADYITQYIKAQ